MIGIDIIDIAETRKTTNWQRSRFLDKIFTLKEQKLIQNSNTPFIMVWRLWSMKEAAYKLYTQSYPERFYKPKQFQCDINGSKMKVRYENFQCVVTTKITNTYILSEASLTEREMTSKTFKLAFEDYAFQSKTTKQALISAVSKQTNLSKSKLEIIKSNFGTPLIYYNSEPLDIVISLSHHGFFGAYGFMQQEL